MGLVLSAAGCVESHSPPERVWGSRGIQDGEFVRPRAVAIDSHDRLYIVDYTARIQIFDRDGNYLGPTWTTPDYRDGRPSGLSIDRDNNLIVSDSHYHCFRIWRFTDDGFEELKKIGGEGGTGPGQLGYVSDVVQDQEGFYYVAELGQNHRVQKFTADGRSLGCWGGPGREPGQLHNPWALAVDSKGRVHVLDTENHRVQRIKF